MDRTTCTTGGDSAADLSAGSSRADQTTGASTKFTVHNYAENTDERTIIENAPLLQPQDNDFEYTFEFIDNMEKVKKSRFAYFMDKLAVESEPGLTNAQLMCVSRRHDICGA